jgi:hypothetical protein
LPSLELDFRRVDQFEVDLPDIMRQLTDGGDSCSEMLNGHGDST